MNKICTFFFALFALPFFSKAQFGFETQDTSWKKNYRATETKMNDLIHTRLDVRFDYEKSYMYGKEWLTLKPTFYPTDSVILDAKGMEIKEVSLMTGEKKSPLVYSYDGQQLHIKLNRVYSNKEKYTLFFNYTSKPNELKAAGSAAITDAKGLYFINPKGDIKDKPTQIWTQGETESNSAWMITIDKPNQKSTEEIFMTVPKKYVTLSNGLLVDNKENLDGTRTDHWKMDLPHAPYLFFMGVGDYAIVKDNYNGKPVNYYVEKSYQPFAKGIFGNTPEMMGFFSKKLGVEFPWPKYSQIVGRDYVSGAMENTTATLHQESAYQNARQLTDGNAWEETIAHELFHQWFGDLVTTESWSNITVNESFANYSEYLWDEYKYGKDFADAHNYEDMQGYFMSGGENKNLVRFYYSSREDVFDGVSYNKGGRILHMLRNYVGDDAFFKSLNNYLTTNKFKTGEAHQLRLAFEEVTGKDLNWFWNQWYYGSGHPKLTVNYDYSVSGKSGVFIKQTQKTAQPFILPIAVDIYANGNKTRQNIILQNWEDTFYFNTPIQPEWISVDADRILLAEITDNKTMANYAAQFALGKNYMDRKDALLYFARKRSADLIKGLKDPYFELRIEAIKKLSASPFKRDSAVIATIESIAKIDSYKKVKAAAIEFLGKIEDPKYKSLFENALNDSSYSVAGEAFIALLNLDNSNDYSLAKKYAADAKGTLQSEISRILLEKGIDADFEIISKAYSDAPLNQEKLGMSNKFLNYLCKVTDLSKIKSGIDKVITLRNMIPEQYRYFVDQSLKDGFDKLSKSKGKEIEDYISDQLK